MASNFDLSLSYVLSCLRLEGLEVKDKQLEAIKAVYNCKDVFSVAAYGVWQISLLPVPPLLV